jgi:hypothetical protein
MAATKHAPWPYFRMWDTIETQNAFAKVEQAEHGGHRSMYMGRSMTHQMITAKQSALCG